MINMGFVTAAAPAAATTAVKSGSSYVSTTASTSVAAACLAAALLLHFVPSLRRSGGGGGGGFGRGGGGRGGGQHGYLPRWQIVLVFAASAGLAGLSVGQQVNRAATTVQQSISTSVAAQVSSAAVLFIITTGLLFFVWHCFRQRDAALLVLIATALIPIVGVAAPGFAGGLVHLLMRGTAAFFTWIFGWAGLH